MGKIRSFLRKLQKMQTLYARLLFVVLAFALMVVTSSLFVSDMLRDHLRRDATDMLTQTKLKIEAEFVEPQTALAIVSNTIRTMILRGENSETVFRYLKNIHQEMEKKMGGFIFDGFFAYFESFGGVFFHSGDWTGNENYDPTDRPWYKAAVDAGSQIAVTPIYFGARTNQWVITYVHRLLDDEGAPLAVVCLNMPVDRIRSIASEMKLTKSSYGILEDENFDVIFHPNSEFVGKNVYDIHISMAEIPEAVKAGDGTYSSEAKNSQGLYMVAYGMALENGWILSILTPKDEYYQALQRMQLILIILGTALALALSFVLVSIDRAKNRVDEENRQKSMQLASMEQIKLMMDKIDQRDKLLNTVNQVATVLLSTEDKGNMITPIRAGMELLGRVVDLDRVQIWQNEWIGGVYCFVHKYEWLSETGEQKAFVPIGLHFPYSSKPEWESKFLRGECINGPLRDLPSGDQDFLSPYDIQSIVIIPLFLQDKFWGFFSLDDCAKERTFSEEEIDILRSGGLLMANAFLRNDMTLNIRSAAVQLEAALREAQDANAAKSKFLATMSHEIRTPMNVILGVTESYLEDKSFPKDVLDGYEKIYNAGDLLLHIINDILDLSKIEAGKLELFTEKYGIMSLINDAAHLNVLKFQHKPIKFNLLVDENIPLELSGDELRIKQILSNLLTNAFKYTDSGEVTLSFSLENQTEFHPENSIDPPGGDKTQNQNDTVTLVLCVSDTGQGMTQEQVDKLFDEYTRFNLETNRTTVGTGLGMAITRNLVRLMNGILSVDSKPGRGSIFTVRLPQGVNGSEVIGKETSENLQNFIFKNAAQTKNKKVVRELMPYGKVLVVDDMVSNLDVAKLLLKPYQLQIETAESGFDAVERIKSGKVYDIVFMDHMMPKMDGVETTKTIRELGYNHPVIALTANAVLGQSEMFLANGFDGYISKPIDIRQLNDSLNRFIRDKERSGILQVHEEKHA